MPKSKLCLKRLEKGWTALEFSMRLKAAGLERMTEGRLFRIETMRARATPEEQVEIARQLDVSEGELFL